MSWAFMGRGSPANKENQEPVATPGPDSRKRGNDGSTGVSPPLKEARDAYGDELREFMGKTTMQLTLITQRQEALAGSVDEMRSWFTTVRELHTRTEALEGQVKVLATAQDTLKEQFTEAKQGITQQLTHLRDGDVAALEGKVRSLEEELAAVKATVIELTEVHRSPSMNQGNGRPATPRPERRGGATRGTSRAYSRTGVCIFNLPYPEVGAAELVDFKGWVAARLAKGLGCGLGDIRAVLALGSHREREGRRLQSVKVVFAHVEHARAMLRQKAAVQRDLGQGIPTATVTVREDMTTEERAEIKKLDWAVDAVKRKGGWVRIRLARLEYNTEIQLDTKLDERGQRKVLDWGVWRPLDAAACDRLWRDSEGADHGGTEGAGGSPRAGAVGEGMRSKGRGSDLGGETGGGLGGAARMPRIPEGEIQPGDIQQ